MIQIYQILLEKYEGPYIMEYKTLITINIIRVLYHIVII